MPSKAPQHRFADILDNIGFIENATSGVDFTEFVHDQMRRDSVLFCLLRLSEAAKKLGPTAEILAPDQPWPIIRALGNRLRHEYDAIELDQIWSIIREGLPSLRQACEQAIAALNASSGAPHGS
ncbi:MAG: DUF86 domain-containing protein [Alphaproteobacteria bacterium]|nr:DUF86 domain-containing protein [Alphaproteobacteria bacterium]